MKKAGETMKQYKILLVDDEEETLNLLDKKLISLGYKILKANNGRDAFLLGPPTI